MILSQGRRLIFFSQNISRNRQLQPEINLTNDPVQFVYGAFRDITLLHPANASSLSRMSGDEADGRLKAGVFMVASIGDQVVPEDVRPCQFATQRLVSDAYILQKLGKPLTRIGRSLADLGFEGREE